MNDELKIPDWLKDCYKTLTTWEHEDRSFTEADRIFEISLIERIAKLEALVREYRNGCLPHDMHAFYEPCRNCRRADELKG